MKNNFQLCSFMDDVKLFNTYSLGKKNNQDTHLHTYQAKIPATHKPQNLTELHSLSSIFKRPRSALPD